MEHNARGNANYRHGEFSVRRKLKYRAPIGMAHTHAANCLHNEFVWCGGKRRIPSPRCSIRRAKPLYVCTVSCISQRQGRKPVRRHRAAAISETSGGAGTVEATMEHNQRSPTTCALTQRVCLPRCGHEHRVTIVLCGETTKDTKYMYLRHFAKIMLSIYLHNGRRDVIHFLLLVWEKKKIVARIFFWLQQATAVWLRHRTPFAYGGDNDWMGYLLRQRTILLRFDANNRSCVVHLPRDAADQQVHAKLSLLLLPRTGVPLPHVYDKERIDCPTDCYRFAPTLEPERSTSCR